MLHSDQRACLRRRAGGSTGLYARGSPQAVPGYPGQWMWYGGRQGVPPCTARCAAGRAGGKPLVPGRQAAAGYQAAARARGPGTALSPLGPGQLSPAGMPPRCAPASSASAAAPGGPVPGVPAAHEDQPAVAVRADDRRDGEIPHGRGSQGPQLLHGPGAGHRPSLSASRPGWGGPASVRRPKARSRRSAGDRPNGIVGYQDCLNALACSAACRVTAWLIVVSSWSVRSSRLLART